MRGFTLIELILVIAIISIVATLSVPFIQIFQTSSDFYTHVDTITKTLRKARHLAVTGKNGSDWGVYFDNIEKKIILFKGNNFAARDTNYDLEEKYADIFSVNADFGNEIYFALYSGLPSAYGTVTASTIVNNDIKYINIQSFGLINK